MPEISRFRGIVIRMYYREHGPAHFHAKHGDHEVVVHLDDGLVEGRFPKTALRDVLAWYDLHRKELEDNWKRAARGLALQWIAPLE